MVLLVEKFNKFCSKLENHLHHHHHHDESPEALLVAASRGFESSVSSFINQLCLNSKPGSEILSLSWIHQCFHVLSMINRAFAKLAVDIDHPISKWKAASVEEYLKYSLNVLDLLNLVSASLSHLGQVRICLFHALSLVESSPSSALDKLKAIKLKGLSTEFKVHENMEGVDKERSCPDKEWAIHQALMELKGVGFALYSVVLAGLSGDAKVYLDRRKLIGVSSISSLTNLDSSLHDFIEEKGVVLKEIEELNDGAVSVKAAIAKGRSSDAAEDMKRRLKDFEKAVDGLGKEVEALFSEVMAERKMVLDGFRFRKH